MNSVAVELKNWLFELCDRDSRCDAIFRDLLREDKDLIKNINEAFLVKDINRVKSLIKKYKSDKGVIFFPCLGCQKRNVVFIDKLSKTKCFDCGKMVIKTVELKLNDFDSNKKVCIYCGDPVASIPGSITCYNHRNVTFNVYE